MSVNIYDACRQGNVAALRVSLSSKNINAKDEGDNKKTALHIACYHGHIDVINVLLNYSTPPDLNARDQLNYTPLHYAVIKRHHEVIYLLLNTNRVDINSVCGEKGFSALMWASYYGDPDIVHLLLQAGANPNIRSKKGFTALNIADRMNTQACVDVLVMREYMLNESRSVTELIEEKARILDNLNSRIRQLENLEELYFEENKNELELRESKKKALKERECLIQESLSNQKILEHELNYRLSEMASMNNSIPPAELALNQAAEDAGIEFPIYKQFLVLKRNLNLRIRQEKIQELEELLTPPTTESDLKKLNEWKMELQSLRCIGRVEINLEFLYTIPSNEIALQSVELMNKLNDPNSYTLNHSKDISDRKVILNEYEKLYEEWKKIHEKDQLIEKIEDLKTTWIRPSGGNDEEQVTVTKLYELQEEVKNLLKGKRYQHYHDFLAELVSILKEEGSESEGGGRIGGLPREKEVNVEKVECQTEWEEEKGAEGAGGDEQWESQDRSIAPYSPLEMVNEEILSGNIAYY